MIFDVFGSSDARTMPFEGSEYSTLKIVGSTDKVRAFVLWKSPFLLMLSIIGHSRYEFNTHSSRERFSRNSVASVVSRGP